VSLVLLAAARYKAHPTLPRCGTDPGLATWLFGWGLRPWERRHSTKS